jgi:hypothetical protein
MKIASPLAEKRVIHFLIRKQMIGRRAYSDTIRTQKVKPLNKEANAVRTYKNPEETPSPPSTPEQFSQADLEARVYSIFAC